MVIPKYSCLFAFFLFMISPVIHGDEGLIHEQCTHAEVPEPCIRCCESNPHARDADLAGLATIVLGCVADHATNLASIMSDLASGAHNASVRHMYQQCSGFFAGVQNNVSTAIAHIRSAAYDEADRVVGIIGQSYHDICYVMIDNGIDGGVLSVPRKVQHEMSAFDELDHAAARMIEHLGV